MPLKFPRLYNTESVSPISSFKIERKGFLSSLIKLAISLSDEITSEKIGINLYLKSLIPLSTLRSILLKNFPLLPDATRSVLFSIIGVGRAS